MSSPEKKNSHEWKATRQDLVIMDPDGWDRSNYEASMAELITEEEFDDRVSHSTCMIYKPENQDNSTPEP